MIADKNFRMSRETKTALALMQFPNKQARSEFKKIMIEAQLQEEAARRAALKSKDTKSKDKDFE